MALLDGDSQGMIRAMAAMVSAVPAVPVHYVNPPASACINSISLLIFDYPRAAGAARQESHERTVEGERDIDRCGPGESAHGVAPVWRAVPETDRPLIDARRATEDGSEAITLGLIYEARRWLVTRRLQRRQYGDWLIEEQGSGRKVVLEVGGLDDGSLAAKLSAELAQVTRCPLPYDQAVCVVRFADVSATLLEVPYAAD